ncbi:hypothetical protein [Haladaptatus sp. DYF46]|uniref:hypothetical protein n=1 Tax=Haladaptatus sp. DYF46 TaxID=2886041 RepID=UPI001E2A2D87|nr:hypothetical protein [Haladaptatus sp. DYF46]
MIGTAGRAIDVVTPANLLAQIRGPTLRDKLFSPTYETNGRHGTVMFQYYGYEMTVTDDRTVKLNSLNPSETSSIQLLVIEH